MRSATVACRAVARCALYATRATAPRLGGLPRFMSAYGKGIPVPMPALSPTMTVGKIGRWNKKEGDTVNAGDVLCEVETDKATVDFNFQDDGMILARVLVPAGSEDVAIGTPLALMVEDAKDFEAVNKMALPAGNGAAAPAAAKAPAPPASAGAAAAPAAAPPAAASAGAAAAALPPTAVMPAARLLMAVEGVHPGALTGKGTGKGGRITKGDVLAHLGKIPPPQTATAAAAAAPAAAAAAAAAPSAGAASTAAAAAASAYRQTAAPVAPVIPADAVAKAFAAPPRAGGSFTDTKPSQVRRVIATRLAESKARIPHQYASIETRIDGLTALRATLKASGINVSVNDMVIKAAAKALVAVPEANAHYDAKTDAIVTTPTVDVSVAVATDGGLITPIVKGADGLGLVGINERVKDLATRARANKLKPDEFQGGTFTISNLGMFGIDAFTAVINPPQACILAVGKGEKRVLPAGSSAVMAADMEALAASGSLPPADPVVATVMEVQLSSDARVVDAGIAGQFLAAFKHYVENPMLLVA